MGISTCSIYGNRMDDARSDCVLRKVLPQMTELNMDSVQQRFAAAVVLVLAVGSVVDTKLGVNSWVWGRSTVWRVLDGMVVEDSKVVCPEGSHS